MNQNHINTWLNYKGKVFFKDIGMRKNQFILDFGCGRGNYTIPAALTVGKSGRIYAIDKNRDKLDYLRQRIEKYRLHNIEVLLVKERDKLPFPNELLDIVLLYDVIHLIRNRETLLSEIYRVLKPYGILSVYPKHHLKDMKMNIEEVRINIESVGFTFNVKLLKLLMHDNQLEKGYVLNFGKNLTIKYFSLTNNNKLSK